MKRKQPLGIGLACALSSTVMGAGFQLYTEGSAEALGQAAAISGRDDLASLAWYNPAALAGCGDIQLMGGASFVQIRTDFSGAAGSASMADDWRIIPHAYYVQPLASNLTASLSINTPYGLITEWPDNWIGNPAATYSEFTTIYVTPSVGYRVSEQLSVAAGFNVVYADAELSASRDLSGLGGPNFGLRTVKGDDLGYGYTASVHGKPATDWSVGARYQSRVKVKLDGDVEFDANPVPPGNTSFPGNAEVELPASINAGVVNRSFERLQLGLDIIWTEWSTYDQLVYRFAPGYPAPPLSNPEVNPKRWEDVWSVRIGAEYDLGETWVVRTGYVWDQSPVPDSTRAPELPGSDRQMVMAGVGWSMERLSIDLAYAFLWAEDSQTGAGVVASVPSLDGAYDTTTQILSVSVGTVF